MEDEGNDECETILDILPPEVLELILMNLSYQEIAQTIRLVSKYPINLFHKPKQKRNKKFQFNLHVT